MVPRVVLGMALELTVTNSFSLPSKTFFSIQSIPSSVVSKPGFLSTTILQYGRNSFVHSVRGRAETSGRDKGSKTVSDPFAA